MEVRRWLNILQWRLENKKNIALIAHDGKKQDMLKWCMENKEILQQHNLSGTGTTARMIADYVGLKIKVVHGTDGWNPQYYYAGDYWSTRSIWYTYGTQKLVYFFDFEIIWNNGFTQLLQGIGCLWIAVGEKLSVLFFWVKLFWLFWTYAII